VSVPAILARYPNVEPDGRNSWATDWSGANYPSVPHSPDPFVNHFASVPYRTASEAMDSESTDGGYLFNVLEELDSPGEYWIDRDNGFAYLWPLVADTNPTADGGEVIVGTTAAPILTFGSDSHHIEARGLLIEGGQTDCVSMAGASNMLTFSTVRNCGSNIITMEGSDHVVDHNRLYNSGNDTIACSASAASITNNEISEYGRLRTTTVAALRVGAQDIYFAHNRIHDGPSYALYIGRAGLVMEYNDLSRLPLDGSDNGMVYAWASSETHLDGTIRYNYFHDAPRSWSSVNWGSAAIYYDEMVDEMATYGSCLCVGACAGPGLWRVGCISKVRTPSVTTCSSTSTQTRAGRSRTPLIAASATHRRPQLSSSAPGQRIDGTDYSSLPQAAPPTSPARTALAELSMAPAFSHRQRSPSTPAASTTSLEQHRYSAVR
jgi:hypothetical protein